MPSAPNNAIVCAVACRTDRHSSHCYRLKENFSTSENKKTNFNYSLRAALFRFGIGNDRIVVRSRWLRYVSFQRRQQRHNESNACNHTNKRMRYENRKTKRKNKDYGVERSEVSAKSTSDTACCGASTNAWKQSDKGIDFFRKQKDLRTRNRTKTRVKLRFAFAGCASNAFFI